MTSNEQNITKKLHQKARHFNWDDGLDGLYKIIENKKCDKGTALMIFRMGRPEWNL
ncbi:MAG: DUF4274 domain-containing protein [Candidatus Lokiarchaeota archaeon]|nr:DUF4274 domain-containing protein [Candidatus Lokiarchaeota archaeon]MBD3341743.1 DUF4274 domain-containing protein [Candidatus Lokiarchaeota archaeon]